MNLEHDPFIRAMKQVKYLLKPELRACEESLGIIEDQIRDLKGELEWMNSERKRSISQLRSM